MTHNLYKQKALMMLERNFGTIDLESLPKSLCSRLPKPALGAPTGNSGLSI